MKKIYAILLTAAALAGLPRAMRAQQLPPPPPANWILDNFKIGAGGVSSFSGVKNVTLPSNPDSELIGGSRYIILNPAQNPYNQFTEVQVRPSASASVPSSLFWSVGYGTAAAMGLVYGDNPSPLNLNLTGYDRLRLVFGGLSNALNDLCHSGAAGQWSSVPVQPRRGDSQQPIPQRPSSIDCGFSSERLPCGHQPERHPGDRNNLPGGNLAITKFLAIPTGSTEPAANFTCGA
jgi:hypothetical protein